MNFLYDVLNYYSKNISELENINSLFSAIVNRELESAREYNTSENFYMSLDEKKDIFLKYLFDINLDRDNALYPFNNKNKITNEVIRTLSNEITTIIKLIKSE